MGSVPIYDCARWGARVVGDDWLRHVARCRPMTDDEIAEQRDSYVRSFMAGDFEHMKTPSPGAATG